MRISDWSSDVCSSDLAPVLDRVVICGWLDATWFAATMVVDGDGAAHGMLGCRAFGNEDAARRAMADERLGWNSAWTGVVRPASHAGPHAPPLGGRSRRRRTVGGNFREADQSGGTVRGAGLWAGGGEGTDLGPAWA